MIITPETHPRHPVVGSVFGARSTTLDKVAIYYCESYDSEVGYLMDNMSDPEVEDKVVAVDYAIGYSFWPATEHNDHWYIPHWDLKVAKPA